MNKAKKRIMSIVLVFILITSITSTAFADTALDRVKAWVATLITASNIALAPINVPADYYVQRAVDPLNLVWTQQEADYYSYMDKSRIRVYPDVIEIDGVQYTDIWLSSDAANQFKTDALDFMTAYNLASNSQATYAEGIGFANGEPIYTVDGDNRSAEYIIPAEIGQYQTGIMDVNVYTNSSGQYVGTTSINGQNFMINNYAFKGSWPLHNWLIINTNLQRVNLRSRFDNSQTIRTSSNYITINYQEQPFEFEYTASQIDALPITGDDGLYLRVPSEYTNPVTQNTYNFGDLILNYPQLTDGVDIELDPSLNPDFEIDMDLIDDLGDLINTIMNILDLLNNGDENIIADVRPEPETPTPPGPSTDTIANTPWESLRQILNNILQEIQSLSPIKSTIQSIAEWLSSIHQKLEDIGRKIESHPLDLVKRLLQAISAAFAGLFSAVKSNLGIWHYVVEWLASIGAVFGFFFGIMSNVSYNMVLPIYAGIAGAISLALYKRFGR